MTRKSEYGIFWEGMKGVKPSEEIERVAESHAASYDMGYRYGREEATAQYQDSTERAEKRVQELLDANTRFEQRGRCAERLCRMLERIVLTADIGPTLRDMSIITIKEYRKDNPK